METPSRRREVHTAKNELGIKYERPKQGISVCFIHLTSFFRAHPSVYSPHCFQ